jgi:phage-related tail fiber protein
MSKTNDIIENTVHIDGSGLSNTNLTNKTGEVIAYATSTVPNGYLECNGSELSRTTYSALFGVIGTLYGTGDGSTTFNIPDLRGEFIRGWDNGKGVDSGRVIGTGQGDAIRNMTGTIKMSNPNQGGTGIFYNTFTPGADYNSWGSGTCATVNFDASTVVPTANEARPRNIAMMYCIKH